MSADYWNSSQRQYLQLTKQSLLELRRRVLLLERKLVQNGLVKDHPGVVYDFNMRIYLHNLIIKLGRRLSVRQIALATAEVYLARFLTRVLLKEINVYLLITTCLYVLCKIEECPQHIRLMLSEARNIWPEYIPNDITKLAEFEFYLIEELELHLLLHHPYKLLLQIQAFLKENINIYGIVLSDDELQHSWSLINDSYITDLHLLLPPHIIAVALVYITIVLKKHLVAIKNSSDVANQEMHIDDLMALTGKKEKPDATFSDMAADEDTIRINKFMNFLNHLHVNYDQVIDAIQDIINVYIVWNRYNEGNVKRALHMMLLGR